MQALRVLTAAGGRRRLLHTGVPLPWAVASPQPHHQASVVPTPPSMTDAERIMGLVGGFTGCGDLGALTRCWECLSTDEEKLHGIEIIVQTHLFAGYPRTINGLAAVHATGTVPAAALVDAEGRAAPGELAGEHVQQGRSLFERIYGPAAPKVDARIAELHPDFAKWMVHTGYGRVLSRPGPSPKVREYGVLSVLAGQGPNVELQLVSHLMGARRVGATVEDLDVILSSIAMIHGQDAHDFANGVWGRIRSKPL